MAPATQSFNLIAESTVRHFTRQFGRPPVWVAVAPGRVNLIGEHTDYNDGFVMPMAIERFTVMAGDRNVAKQANVHSVTTGETAVIDLNGQVERGKPSWSNYVRGVIAGFQGLKLKVGGFDAVIDSTVPLGSGLSSSAALEVATATLLEGMCDHQLAPIDKALLCQQAEHQFAGVPCGIMDQFTSVLAQPGHLLLLDCQSRKTELVPMSDPAVSVLIINTNVRHELSNGEYARRRAECETAARLLNIPSLRSASLPALEQARAQLGPVVFRRAHHVITEDQRTLRAAKALQASDWNTVGEMMYASHKSLRDDYEVSCVELDAVVDIAARIGDQGGVIGCRMTGGGFGGCTVALVRSETVPELTKQIGEAYQKKTGIAATIFSTRPAAGAQLLK